ncbi:putative membrane protein YagU involved in acid resistance [Metabacillus crassostreae]|uniref:hypothetical protein n=1 Tax=Metabacillus crassostreae TaxID=929098 RepID=UPI001957CE96|nr:hypothetical protein [Metabacillus crassostreae]MBM7603476.1 putative membrane protein YagU involved in acid resistance [Metabacillus crassostreae]
MVKLKTGLFTGLISGVILGLFLKSSQMITGHKVYTLLLNIDFLYNKPLPEMIEFVLHLLISVIIGIVYISICDFKGLVRFKEKFILSLILTAPTFLLYFPLTILAIKNTPSVSNISAISLWVIGHLLYALILPISFKRSNPNK